jgi:hypothetical protein
MQRIQIVSIFVHVGWGGSWWSTATQRREVGAHAAMGRPGWPCVWWHSKTAAVLVCAGIVQLAAAIRRPQSTSDLAFGVVSLGCDCDVTGGGLCDLNCCCDPDCGCSDITRYASESSSTALGHTRLPRPPSLRVHPMVLSAPNT